MELSAFGKSWFPLAVYGISRVALTGLGIVFTANQS
jgi:hypothetical protein